MFRTKLLCKAFLFIQIGFVIFWQKNIGEKVSHKMLMKLTPGYCFWFSLKNVESFFLKFGQGNFLSMIYGLFGNGLTYHKFRTEDS